MDTLQVVKSIVKIFFISRWNVHLIVFILTFLFFGIFNKLEISDEAYVNGDFLTSISIISSFFLMTVQRVDYKHINEKFTSEIKVFGTKHNKESEVIRNTVFSIAISIFILTGVCFLLQLASIVSLFLLIWLLFYLFVGVVYTFVLWNYFSAKM